MIEITVLIVAGLLLGGWFVLLLLAAAASIPFLFWWFLKGAGWYAKASLGAPAVRVVRR